MIPLVILYFNMFMNIINELKHLRNILSLCVCVCLWVAQSCPTLCDPINCSLPGSSVHGILQARILKAGCHFLFQGIFPTQGSNPLFLQWQVDFLPLCHLGRYLVIIDQAHCSSLSMHFSFNSYKYPMSQVWSFYRGSYKETKGDSHGWLRRGGWRNSVWNCARG